MSNNKVFLSKEYYDDDRVDYRFSDIDIKLMLYGLIKFKRKFIDVGVYKNKVILDDKFEEVSKNRKWLWENLRVGSLRRLIERIESYPNIFYISVIKKIDDLVCKINSDERENELFRDYKEEEKETKRLLEIKNEYIWRFNIRRYKDIDDNCIDDYYCVD